MVKRKMKKTFSCTIPVAPVPASRPRVGRWGVFYAKTYLKWRREADEALKKLRLPLTSKPLSVSVTQVCYKPATTKRPWPRGDVDNHAKSVLDAITRAPFGWRDDDQILELTITKRYAEDGEEPRSEVEWRTVVTS